MIERIDLNKAEKISQQVDRWDLFARLVPTLFLLTNILLISFEIISFDSAFYVGLGMFAVTAVVWWWWAIFTIRHLVLLLNRASKNLVEVTTEVKGVSTEIEKLKDES